MKITELINILMAVLKEEGDSEIIPTCSYCNKIGKELFVFTENGKHNCGIEVGEWESGK